MSETVIPLVTETLGVKPELAAKVIQGLSNGTYERVGGVIRRAKSKEIVAWLRSMGENVQIDVYRKLLNLGPLMQLNAATSLLNLTVTAVGFAMVMQRLCLNMWLELS